MTSTWQQVNALILTDCSPQSLFTCPRLMCSTWQNVNQPTAKRLTTTRMLLAKSDWTKPKKCNETKVYNRILFKSLNWKSMFKPSFMRSTWQTVNALNLTDHWLSEKKTFSSSPQNESWQKVTESNRKSCIKPMFMRTFFAQSDSLNWKSLIKQTQVLELKLVKSDNLKHNSSDRIEVERNTSWPKVTDLNFTDENDQTVFWFLFFFLAQVV